MVVIVLALESAAGLKLWSPSYALSLTPLAPLVELESKEAECSHPP